MVISFISLYSIYSIYYGGNLFSKPPDPHISPKPLNIFSKP